MSIDARCQEQRSAADRMFMDFKYTRPGSKEQVQALATLSFLIGMWADFLTAEEKRMDQVMALEAGNSLGLDVDHVGRSSDRRSSEPTRPSRDF